MRVLVTGYRGFIGRHLVEALRKAEWCRHADGIDIAGASRGVRDCRDLAFPTTACETHYDLVFHCAATVGGREGIDFNAALLGANNLQLDGAMFEWALRTRPGRFVYFSSAAAYPTYLQTRSNALDLHEDYIGPMDPDGTACPDESYGWAKLTGEVIAERVRRAGVPVTVVRPFSSYDFDQDDCYPFPEFIKRAKRGDDPFVVWGDGSQVRDFIHVDDVVNAVLVLAREGVDGPVNLGTGVATSMDTLAAMCMAGTDYATRRVEHLIDKPVGVHRRVADITRLRRYYTPRIGLEEGVRRALDACRV